MVSTKYEIDKFTSTGEFTLWAKKIKAILTAQKEAKAVEDAKKLPATVTNDQKQTMEDVACTTLILNSLDNALRQVIDEITDRSFKETTLVI